MRRSAISTQRRSPPSRDLACLQLEKGDLVAAELCSRAAALHTLYLFFFQAPEIDF